MTNYQLDQSWHRTRNKAMADLAFTCRVAHGNQSNSADGCGLVVSDGLSLFSAEELQLTEDFIAKKTRQVGKHWKNPTSLLFLIWLMIRSVSLCLRGLWRLSCNKIRGPQERVQWMQISRINLLLVPELFETGSLEFYQPPSLILNFQLVNFLKIIPGGLE